MDQSLKERLIGAAVLVVLGVWLIPWLLDGRQEQPTPGSSSSALRLPAPDGPLPVRSQTLALDSAKSGSAPFTAEAAHGDVRTESTTVAVAEPTEPPTSTQPTPTATPQHVAPVGAKPGGEPSTAQRATPAPATKPVEPSAARAATARTDAHGDWAVQLGVFSAEDNARRLAQKVNVYGYKPEVVSYKPNGRALYRVRLGPYASRAEADATASALSARSLTAQVVAAD